MKESQMKNNEACCKIMENINLTINLIDNMCSYIYTGEGGKIFDNLGEFINELDFILTNVKYVINGIDMIEFDKILINIEGAISIKDYVLFADILIYELKPVLKELGKLLITVYENK